jgi:glycosyltransferase involved in cell wall biosynthesis
VASDTQPLHEAIRHNDTGKLISFFDPAALAQSVCELLDQPEERARLGANARAFAQQHYDLKTVCLPQQLVWVNGLVK